MTCNLKLKDDGDNLGGVKKGGPQYDLFVQKRSSCCVVPRVEARRSLSGYSSVPGER